MRDLRIAVVAAGEIFGGAERQILTFLGTAAPRLRSKPELLIFHDGELADRARALGIPVQVLGASGIVDWKARERLREILDQRQFDVLNINGYRAAVYVYVALATRRGRPVPVKTEHGGVEGGSSRLNHYKAHVYRWLENRATYRLGATIVYVTDELRRACAREHRGLATKVIHNGIAPPKRASTTRPAEYRQDRRNLVIVGRLERVKGIAIAIRAIAESAVLSTQSHLFVIGSGPELGTLEQLALQLGISDRVSFAGFRVNAYDYIAHADALLIPSLHEGLPYTLLEALALETPVIASRVGGLVEVLEHGQSALLVQPGSPHELAASVELLIQSPELRRTLAFEGKQLVMTRFTAEAMTYAYLDLFDTLLSASSRYKDE